MKLLVWIAAAIAAYLVVMTIALSAAIGGGGQSGGQIVTRVDGIPPEYLALYQQAATDNGIDWAILAGIGKVETNHGRSTAQGVHSGVNAYGCCAGPMQFSVVGSPSTWDSYGAGGDVYDPRDAIPAAARYLVASGAPRNYHRAILAYNNAEWYVSDVMTAADRYRAAAHLQADGAGPGVEVGANDGEWLATVPGTSVQCDRRIVPDVVVLRDRYHLVVSSCYAPTGHQAGGEHPLGLAIDAEPAPPASWGMLDQMAHDLGWRESCASTGCAGQTGTNFRFIGWNGYQGHGDPEHAGGNAHIHLSWSWGGHRGPPAVSVRVLAAG